MYIHLKTIVKSLLLAVVLLSSSYINAQSALDLRINEYMVVNDSNVVDELGNRSAWVEIFNSAYNTVNLGGLYITDDLSNPTKYYIPKGFSQTKIAPQNHLLLFADGKSDIGVLHLPLALANVKFLALFDGDGKTLIDSVSICSALAKNRSVGRDVDGKGKWQATAIASPEETNAVLSRTKPVDTFAKIDPKGTGITTVSMLVVFSALALLTIIFVVIGNFMSGVYSFKKKTTQKQTTQKQTTVAPADAEMSGEVAAAIALVLSLHVKNLRADENNVLTIQRAARTYSPWSSKIYQIRQLPR
ncbi:MAG: lamin tail domain-containing protein [Breznakibacter sp.]|nr:lamin tail domain-containing protein [Breznakibacter sp.]